MTPYIALVWNASSPLATRDALRHKVKIEESLVGYQKVLDVDGMYVCACDNQSADKVYHMTAGRGVVIGRLFERAYIESDASDFAPPRDVTLDELTSARSVDDAGSTLNEKYWGRYVAFIHDSGRGKSWILRDPTGAQPCQHISLNGIHVYFARLSDVMPLGLFELKFNRGFLIGNIAFRRFVSEETGYEEITTVLPGQRVEVSGSRCIRSLYWNPIDLAQSRTRMAPDDVANYTRRIVSACARAWASCFEAASLQLSGGLDSTVLAAVLASAPCSRKPLCINFYDRRETSDERAFAREVARHLGLELLELDASDRGTIETESSEGLTVVPSSVVRSQSWSDVYGTLVSRGVTANFRGDGGDELFHRDGPIPDSVDRAWSEGFSLGLLRTALNDAIIERSSVWKVLRAVVRYGLLKRAYDVRGLKHVDGMSLLTAQARREATGDDRHWHPLYRHNTDCPPAKLVQCFRLMKFTHGFYMPPKFASQPETIAPLISQPHMEFSLRTPLHLLRFGGRDRSAARSAFQGRAPEIVLKRKYKSLSTFPSGYWISQKLNSMREFLIGGHLADMGVVDKRIAERLFANIGALSQWQADQLFACICTEAWLRAATNVQEMRVSPSSEACDVR